jgi:hypothetical protein
MGFISALGIAETNTNIEQQVSWHFSSNCYPPVPQQMVPFAVKAIKLAIADDWDELVPCPEGVSWRGQTSVRVHDVIEALYLNAFIDCTEED